LVGIFAGEKLLERLLDVDLEATGLQRCFVVTDATSSNGTVAEWGIARGIVYIG
jgi:hypothetical protein